MIRFRNAGRAVSIPFWLVLVVVTFITNINFSNNKLRFELNIIALALLAGVLFMLCKYLISARRTLLVVLYLVSLLIFQSLFISALVDINLRSGSYDLSANISGTFILPLSLIAVQLWGWYFDYINNKQLVEEQQPVNN